MKNGRSISELAMEIERQQSAKKDYIVPMGRMEMSDMGTLFLDNGNERPVLPFTKHAHGQISDFTKIPRKYYNKMLEDGAGDLLATNVNHWFDKKPNDKRMVRTLDGQCRAFLSSRYRILDNSDMMEAVLPVLSTQDIQIASCDVTDKRLYIKALFPKLEGEVSQGDVVQSGIVISNSEIGSGGLKVQPLIYRLVCTNGMILPDSSIKKYHVGRDQGGMGDIQELLSDATKEQNDRAFWMSVQDVVKASYNEAFFQDQLLKMREAAGVEIESKKLDKVVEVATKKMGFGETVQETVLDFLIRGGDLSKWGLANAFTASANDQEDYELATDLERAGGDIIELNQRDWNVIAKVS